MSTVPRRTASPALVNQLSDTAHNYVDSQRSLHNASMALDAAYNRIRQVRRSLLQVSDPSSSQEPQRPAPRSEIRPGHRALILSEGSGGEEGNQELDALQELEVLERLAHSSIASPESSALGSNSRTRNRSTGSDAPNPPAPTVLPPRFSRQPEWFYLSQLQRQGANSQSAATTRGLQVAAREAGLALPTSNADSDLQRLGVDFASLTAQYRDILEAQRRASPGPDGIRPREMQDGHSTAARAPGDAQPPVSTFRRDARRWRSRETRSYMDPGFVAGVYAERDQAAAEVNASMRQSSSYTPATRVTSDPRLRYYPTDPSVGGWSIANLDSADWGNDEMWFAIDPQIPRPPAEIQASSPAEPNEPENGDGLLVRTTIAGPPRGASIRRGWARLDADGNEISYSEEEELERSRTEYRLRALRRARQQHAPSGVSIHGSVMDSALNIPTVRRESSTTFPSHHSSSDSRSFYVDPLPMPLSSMVTINKPTDVCHPDVIVPIHACLAGR
ncbi:hypothetical protein NLJ89_g7064 [Agrocybe chaxingu]|uniref:Uncharacterized protein n=1 Tax=Agrocybe chaxingu TaxID=84603 RepID=A0A9W8JXX3_9AGAR|nr:hypothetical protein NLJ89_g7064 [Agrocybe chaxingu]